MTNSFELLETECYTSEIEDVFPNRLELLEEFQRIKIFDKEFLKNVSVLFIQHILQPFIGRLNIMQQAGMKDNKTWFVDIPYSTNRDVFSKIRNEYTSNFIPPPFENPLENYSDFQLNRVMQSIKDIYKTKPAKLLVIDDGAYFVRAMHKLYLKEPEIISYLFNKVYIIEQTTRGHRYLNDEKYSLIIQKLNAPIVSIARCKTKLETEAPFIGIACRKAIEENERIISKIESNSSNEANLKTGVIGYGAIGKSVVKSVKKLFGPDHPIDIVEINLNKWNEIEQTNCTPVTELLDDKYDLLFGCTGYNAFSWKDRFKINNKGLLVSVSSASIEFSRSNFLEFADLYPDDPIEIIIEEDEKEKGIHADLLFKDHDLSFYFINSGFPVNFTGKRECLPLKFIQPTHALLYAASYQVLNNPCPGIHSISEEYDNWIYYNSFVK